MLMLIKNVNQCWCMIFLVACLKDFIKKYPILSVSNLFHAASINPKCLDSKLSLAVVNNNAISILYQQIFYWPKSFRLGTWILRKLNWNNQPSKKPGRRFSDWTGSWLLQLAGHDSKWRRPRYWCLLNDT